MNKKMTMRVAAFAAFAVCVALPLCAAELTHRWSFNGDYSDSVGGADAVKCGTYVSLYGGRVHMGYGACSHGTGYVDLGTNMLDTTAATIEIWARHDGAEGGNPQALIFFQMSAKRLNVATLNVATLVIRQRIW